MKDNKLRVYIMTVGIFAVLIALLIIDILMVPTRAVEVDYGGVANGAGRIMNVAQNDPSELVEDDTEVDTNDSESTEVIVDETQVSVDSEETSETTTEVPETDSGLGTVRDEVSSEPVIETPFGEDLQNYTIKVCEEYGVDPALIFAIIEKESGFNVHAVGDYGNSLGLMQIQPRWNQDRMARLNCWDLMDPYQNILTGVDLVSELQETNYSEEGVLMSYNGGQAYADDLLSRGIVSDYAITVLEMRKGY